MIRFGVIGTNWITDRFLRAGMMLDDFKLTAVYSRTEEKAKEFAAKYQVKQTYTDLTEFAKSEAIDAVYIASPTALHCEQAIICMEEGKHVFVEKPFASNQSEVERMIAVARSCNVLLMEGMKTTHLPNFNVLKEEIKTIAPVRRFVANFCQYSSRYDRYKEGEVLNAFKPELSNGSLMDIGVYTAYPMVALFGMPEAVSANVIMLDSGVDGLGTMSIKYPELTADLMFSKITDSHIPSEIQGENGTIVIKKLSDLRQLTRIDKDGTITDLSVEQKDNTMYYEIKHFLDLLASNLRESPVNSFETSLNTIKVLDQARKSVGLVFPADLK
ncbi:Gfo/Idh/MocA family oxidoreductase [Amphibacillus sp. MSJ-3]|uniref:Gfo/Idh/MocA family protein n=1 Tax=Amphibacillus sp. MSJ-3 TaxID=2841505 RepID=UPI001C0ECD16|nr:Gfo/Idh/MocA family oxidoreductase [Amphibacillus sp. MSJ-3]MBU5593891.1 Gfo/Idh/MocA family oxidoreductase [Amphibacillus sp. MSJ-3]